MISRLARQEAGAPHTTSPLCSGWPGTSDRQSHHHPAACLSMETHPPNMSMSFSTTLSPAYKYSSPSLLPSPSLHSTFCITVLEADTAMAAHVDPLVVGRVIGDVVDLFVPTVTMSVRFGTKDLTNGCEIKPAVAAAAPAIHITGRANDLFTMVMIDPDAPSPSEPSMREWLHWLVVNIPGGRDPSQGEEVVPYMGPRPPVGIHRYVMVVYQQKSRMAAPAAEVARARFSTRAFANRHDLGLPVAAMYFNAQKESAKRRRPY